MCFGPGEAALGAHRRDGARLRGAPSTCIDADGPPVLADKVAAFGVTAARRRSLRLPTPRPTPKGGRSTRCRARRPRARHVPCHRPRNRPAHPDRALGLFVRGRELVARVVKGEERGSLRLRVDEVVGESRHRVALGVGLDCTHDPVRRRGFLTRQLARQDVDRVPMGVVFVERRAPRSHRLWECGEGAVRASELDVDGLPRVIASATATGRHRHRDNEPRENLADQRTARQQPDPLRRNASAAPTPRRESSI